MTDMVRVWDPVVRVFHWSLVASVAIAWLSAEEVSSLHEAAGYAVGGLVAVRLLWGIVGSRHARFASFLRGPAATLGYLADILRGRERRYLGHNPAGAAMILALLVTLSGTVATGWLLEDPARQAALPDLPQLVAPAFADDDGDDDDDEGRAFGARSEAIEDLHEALANMLLVLIALHVGGVILASVRHRENLARAMVTGAKRAPGPDDIP